MRFSNGFDRFFKIFSRIKRTSRDTRVTSPPDDFGNRGRWVITSADNSTFQERQRENTSADTTQNPTPPPVSNLAECNRVSKIMKEFSGTNFDSNPTTHRRIFLRKSATRVTRCSSRNKTSQKKCGTAAGYNKLHWSIHDASRQSISRTKRNQPAMKATDVDGGAGRLKSFVIPSSNEETQTRSRMIWRMDTIREIRIVIRRSSIYEVNRVTEKCNRNAWEAKGWSGYAAEQRLWNKRSFVSEGWPGDGRFGVCAEDSGQRTLAENIVSDIKADRQRRSKDSRPLSHWSDRQTNGRCSYQLRTLHNDKLKCKSCRHLWYVRWSEKSRSCDQQRHDRWDAISSTDGLHASGGSPESRSGESSELCWMQWVRNSWRCPKISSTRQFSEELGMQTRKQLNGAEQSLDSCVSWLSAHQ